jgi:hypothetical protein
MHTSLVLVALMGPGAAPAVAAPEAPSWQVSYEAARAAGRQRNKPLAVFLGSGPAGWEKLTEEGGLTRRSRQVLAESYVCVYVDQASPAGRKLAQAFEVSSGTGLVVSSLDGDAQAFCYRGTMSQGELDETLRKYASVGSVRQTETLSRARYASLTYPDGSMRPSTPTYQPVVTQVAPTTQVSYSYAPASYAPPMNYAPAYYGGYSGGFGGGFSGGGGGC